MQFITDKELEKVSETVKDMPSSINIDNVYSDEYLGKILDLAGKMYFVQVDIANMAMAEKMNISYSRSLSIGMTGYSVKTSRMMGIPVGISEGSLYIDVDLNKMSVVSRDGDRQSAIRYAMTTGVASSYYESLIW